ncbi:MAG: CHAT domain-containing protein [Cyanobacteria bacterium P01_A01_bin.114]
MMVLGLGFSLGLPAPSADLPVTTSPLQEAPPDLLAQTASSQGSLLQQGIRQYEAAQYSAAIETWTQALSTLTHSPNDRLNRALILSNLSLAYQHLGQWQAAEEALAESFGQLQSIQDQLSPQAYLGVLAKALNTQGRFYWARGESERALELWQQATVAYQQTDNIVGATGGLMNQAKALQALGLTLQAQARLEQVEQLLAQQPDGPLKATGLRNLGNILRQIGDFAQSQQKLGQSLEIIHQSPSVRASTQMDLGNTQRALGDQATAVGQQAVAQRHFETALGLYRQAALAQPESLLTLQAQLNQLSLLVATRQGALAEALGLRLATAAYELPASRAAVEAQLNLTQSLIKLNAISPKDSTGSSSSGQNAARSGTRRSAPNALDWRDIADLIVSTLRNAQTLQDARAESYALGQLGHVYEMTHQWSSAQAVTQQALSKAEQSAALDIRYQWEWQLGRLLKQQGDRAAAIASYKTAVSTLDQVRRDLLVINSDVQFSFRDNVEPIYRELIALLVESEQNGVLSQDHLKGAIEAVDDLQLAELQNFLHCGLPEVVEISTREVDPTAAVFYPIILPNQLIVIVKLPNSDRLNYHTRFIPQGQVNQTLGTLRKELERRYVLPQGLSLSQQVYDWLILPAKALLAESQVQTLVFVLDGSLRNIPVAALHDGEHYLVENYAVALTPSRRLLQPQRLAQSKPRALLFGLAQIRDNFPAHQGFSPLPAVEDELAQIQSHISGQFFLNQSFTSETLKTKVSGVPFSIVHLATHGQFSSNLDKTFLLAWDKRIQVHELNALLQSRVNATPIELLVLSACETAAGDNRATLGLAGVAVRSGARSTLASLWAVNDQSTAILMAQFYETLAQSAQEVTKAAALRQAQLALMNTEGYESPRFWSPYTLVGNWL